MARPFESESSVATDWPINAGVPRVHVDDPGGEADPLGTRDQRREHGERVEAPGLGDPHRVVAESIGGAHELLDLGRRHRAFGVRQGDGQFHACSFFDGVGSVGFGSWWWRRGRAQGPGSARESEDAFADDRALDLVGAACEVVHGRVQERGEPSARHGLIGHRQLPRADRAPAWPSPRARSTTVPTRASRSIRRARVRRRARAATGSTALVSTSNRATV